MYSNIVISLALLCIASVSAYPKVEIDKATIGKHLQSESYMVGATPAPIGAYPYMAGLLCGRIFSELYCGSSIISSKTILTAAHCIAAVYENGKLYGSLLAKVGTNNWEEGGTVYRFSHNVTHPHYVVDKNKNDLGVLITTEPIVMTKLIQPIKLEYNPVADGAKVKIAGWGLTSLESYVSDILLELNVTVVGNALCSEKLAMRSNSTEHKEFPFDSRLELCTFHSSGHGTCAHDSGSPLALLKENTQVGVVSWGYPCAIGAPDVFARVSAYQQWLEEVIV